MELSTFDGSADTAEGGGETRNLTAATAGKTDDAKAALARLGLANSQTFTGHANVRLIDPGDVTASFDEDEDAEDIDDEGEDWVSAVLGDVFHAMDRTKVPVRHEAKKAFFVALRDGYRNSLN